MVERCAKPPKKHLQGYMIFKNKVRFTQVKRVFAAGDANHAHIEKCQGNVQQNYDYCTKQDKNPVEKGTKPGTNRKNVVRDYKMRQVIDQLVSGCSVSSLVRSDLCHIYVVL